MSDCRIGFILEILWPPRGNKQPHEYPCHCRTQLVFSAAKWDSIQPAKVITCMNINDMIFEVTWYYGRLEGITYTAV